VLQKRRLLVTSFSSNLITLQHYTQIIRVHRITSPDKYSTLAVTKETTSMEMVKNGEMEEKRNWALQKYKNLQKSVHLYHQSES